MKLRNNLLYIAWFQVLVASLGSFYFSEVLEMNPPGIAWLQRMMLFPLVVILPACILLGDSKVKYLTLPLALLGLALAAVQTLQHYAVISTASAACATGVACVSAPFVAFGSVPISLLSFTAFLVVTIALLLYVKDEKNESSETEI